jgi:TonB family protein
MIPLRSVALLAFSLSAFFSPALSAQTPAEDPTYDLPEYDALDLRARNRPFVDQEELLRSQRYPESAYNSGLEGRVVIGILVDTNGSVLRTRIEMSTDPIFSRSTETAVRRLHFKPARIYRQPVRAWISIPFNYILH